VVRISKIDKFNQINDFKNVFQFKYAEIQDEFELKGNWNKEYFKNDNPIVLELGCGKGEYTIGLAEYYKDKNFIGLDIKGNRMWKGANYAINNKLNNVAFVRGPIFYINRLFEKNEVDEIWITFPDPKEKKCKNKQRLTSRQFIEKYSMFLKPNGIIHLKTDHLDLFNYTLDVVNENNYKLIFKTFDLYNNPENINDPILGIRTFYEDMFLQENKLINYLKFIV